MMATAEVLPQIKVQSLTADVEQTRDEESHLSINYVSYNSEELHNHHTPLRAKLCKVTSRVYTKVKSKFKSHRCCVWSSKAVAFMEPHNHCWFQKLF